jgi:hypothetical protein
MVISTQPIEKILEWTFVDLKGDEATCLTEIGVTNIKFTDSNV